MIPQGVQVFVALDPVDLRCSFDRLSGIAKEQMGYESRSGALFVFYGRRRDALKILLFDGGGMCRGKDDSPQLPREPTDGACDGRCGIDATYLRPTRPMRWNRTDADMGMLKARDVRGFALALSTSRDRFTPLVAKCISVREQRPTPPSRAMHKIR